MAVAALCSQAACAATVAQEEQQASNSLSRGARQKLHLNACAYELKAGVCRALQSLIVLEFAWSTLWPPITGHQRAQPRRELEPAKCAHMLQLKCDTGYEADCTSQRKNTVDP